MNCLDFSVQIRAPRYAGLKAPMGFYLFQMPTSATDIALDDPCGVAVDANGNVFIADSGNSEVDELTGGQSSIVAGNDQLSIFAGTGTNRLPTPGPATSSKLDYPTGVVVDGSGDIYIADQENDEEEEVFGATMTTTTPTGTTTTTAGTTVMGTTTTIRPRHGDHAYDQLQRPAKRAMHHWRDADGELQDRHRPPHQDHHDRYRDRHGRGRQEPYC